MAESAHAWFLPKLTALMAEAGQAGIAPDVAVAVMSDLLASPQFNPGTVAEIDENWARDKGEPAYMASEMPISDAASPVPLHGEAIGVGLLDIDHGNNY